jgi:hypothetical protein
MLVAGRFPCLRLLGRAQRGDCEGSVRDGARSIGYPLQTRRVLLELPMYDAFAGLQRLVQFHVPALAIAMTEPRKIFAAPRSGRTGKDYQYKPEAAEALSSHSRVCASVHPGTAKPLGTSGTVIRRPARKWPSSGLARCTVAALAEALKVISRPKTKTDRIICAPFSRPTPEPVPRKDHPARAIS